MPTNQLAGPTCYNSIELITSAHIAVTSLDGVLLCHLEHHTFNVINNNRITYFVRYDIVNISECRSG